MSVFQGLLFVAGMGLFVAILLFLFHYRRLENILHVLQDIRKELRVLNKVQRDWAVEDNFERKLRERASGLLGPAKKEPEPARRGFGAEAERAEGAKEKPEPVQDTPEKAAAPAEASKETAAAPAEAPKASAETPKASAEAPKASVETAPPAASAAAPAEAPKESVEAPKAPAEAPKDESPPAK